VQNSTFCVPSVCGNVNPWLRTQLKCEFILVQIARCLITFFMSKFALKLSHASLQSLHILHEKKKKINQSNVRNYHSIKHLNNLKFKKKLKQSSCSNNLFIYTKKLTKKISNLTFPSKDFMHYKLHPQIIVHVQKLWPSSFSIWIPKNNVFHSTQVHTQMVNHSYKWSCFFQAFMKMRLSSKNLIHFSFHKWQR
jgi:hypothetical protein